MNRGDAVVPALAIDSRGLIDLASGVDRAADHLDFGSPLRNADGGSSRSPLVEAALADSTALLEAHRAVAERQLRALAQDPARAADRFADLDAALAAGV